MRGGWGSARFRQSRSVLAGNGRTLSGVEVTGGAMRCENCDAAREMRLMRDGRWCVFVCGV